MYRDFCTEIEEFYNLVNKKISVIDEESITIEHINLIYKLINPLNINQDSEFFFSKEFYIDFKAQYENILLFENLENLEIIKKKDSQYIIQPDKILDTDLKGRLLALVIEHFYEKEHSQEECIDLICVSCPKHYVRFLKQETKTKLIQICSNYIQKFPISKSISKDKLFEWLHIPHNEDYAKQELNEINFDSPEHIYNSVFIKNYQALDLLSVKGIDSFEMALSCLIECLSIYSPEHENIIKTLLNYSYNEAPVIFYLSLWLFKTNRPDYIPTLFTSPFYGDVFLMLLDDFFCEYIRRTDLKVVSKENIFSLIYRSFDIYINNLSRMIPKEGTYDKLKDISFVLAMLVKKTKYENNPFTNSFFHQRLNLIFGKMTKDFTSNVIPVHYDFIPITEKIITYDLSFLDSQEKLQLFLLIFNYLSKLPDCNNDIKQKYFKAISDFLLEFLFAIKYAESIEYFDFNDFLNREDAIKFVNGLEIEKFEPGANLVLLDIYYQYFIQYRFNLKKKYKPFLLKLISFCFQKQPPENYFNCFINTYDKTMSYLKKTVLLMDYLFDNENELKFVFSQIIDDIPYLQRLYIYNCTNNLHIKKFIENYLITINKDSIENETFDLDEYYKTILTIYNSHLNNELASRMLASFNDILEQKPEFLRKKYKFRTEEFYFFEALNQDNIEILDNINKKYQGHQETYLFYRFLLLCNKGEFQDGLKLLQEIRKKYPDTLKYEIYFQKTLFELHKDISIDTCKSMLVKAIESQEVNLILLSLDLNICLLFEQGLYEEVFQLYLEYKNLIINNDVCPEKLLITFSKLNTGTQMNEYLSTNNNFSKYQNIIQRNNIQIDLSSIEENFKLYLTLRDEDKIKTIPYKINDHQCCKSIFIKNILEKSLIALVSKKYTINRITGFFQYNKLKENELNDLLKILMDNYLVALDFNETSDQPRAGISYEGKDAGSIDIRLKLDEEDFIIEPLWLKSLSSANLDLHINKVYNYSVYGNTYFLVIYYNGKDFNKFNKKLINYLDNVNNNKGKKHNYLKSHELISSPHQEKKNSNLITLKLNMTDSEMYIFVVNLYSGK